MLGVIFVSSQIFSFLLKLLRATLVKTLVKIKSLVAAVVLILFDKVEEVTLLLPGDGFTGDRIIYNN